MSFQQTPIAAIYQTVPNPRETSIPTRPRPRGRPPGSGKKRKDERNEVGTSSQPQFLPLQSESHTPSQTPGSRRRGRPPGSKDSVPRKSAAKIPHMNTSTEVRSSTERKQSDLRNPVTMSSDGFAVVIDSHHTAKKQVTLGPQKIKPIRRDGVVHKVYKCRWNDCPYELHNLQTVRKHVYKHGEQYGKGPFPCCWTDCGTINLSNENAVENELIPLEFDNVSAWKTHIDAKHLNILAWEMGDGPSSSGMFETRRF